MKLLILKSLTSNFLTDFIHFSMIWYYWLWPIDNFTDLEIAMAISVLCRSQMEWWQCDILSLLLLSRIESWRVIGVILRSSVLLIGLSACFISLFWALGGQGFESLLIYFLNLLNCLSICFSFVGEFLNAIVDTIFEFWDSVSRFFGESGGCVRWGLVDFSLWGLEGSFLTWLWVEVRLLEAVKRTHLNNKK